MSTETITITTPICDFCRTHESVYNKCTGCGKDICVHCGSSDKFRHFRAERYALGGPHGGLYCPDCQQDERIHLTALWQLYIELESLQDREIQYIRDIDRVCKMVQQQIAAEHDRIVKSRV